MRRITVPFGGKDYEVELTERRSKDDDRSVWAARCRIPMQGLPMTITRDAPQVRDVSSETKGGPLIVGIASSSSVDWHGTEMSIRALDGMAKQFKNGVVYVPSHREDEWDEVFGRTVDAEIERGNVVASGDEGGPGEGHVLRVTVELFMDDPRAQRLVKMVERGQIVGWSIGGWFTEMEVITNDADEVERMIINDVELDHLATTRRPSNPDSWIRELQRSVSDAFGRSSYEEMKEDEERDEMDEYEEDEERDEIEGYSKDEERDEIEGYSEDEERDEIEGYSEDEERDEIEGYSEDEDREHTDDHVEEEEEDDAKADVFDDEPAGSEDDVDEDADVDDEEDEKEEDMERNREPSHLRHVMEVVETDDAVIVKYGKSKEFEGVKAMDMPMVDEERAVSGSTSLPLADEDMEWDWSTKAANDVLGDDDWARFRRAHLWYDEENPEVRASYKLPIAKMVNGELRAVWRGVSAAMAALNGARGGVDVPDADRSKIYDKISTYYGRFEKGDPPPLARDKSDCITQDIPHLDTTAAPGENSPQVPQAHRSSPPEQIFQPEQEDAVSDSRDTNPTAPSAGSNDMAATLATMNELLQQLVERDRSVAPVTTPAEEEAVNPEVAALHERIADLEGLVARFASKRQGLQHTAARSRDARGVNALVRSATSELGETSALVLVAKEQAERRQATKANMPGRGELESDLRAVLHAALTDGVITDPDARSTWR